MAPLVAVRIVMHRPGQRAALSSWETRVRPLAEYAMNGEIEAYLIRLTAASRQEALTDGWQVGPIQHAT